MKKWTELSTTLALRITNIFVFVCSIIWSVFVIMFILHYLRRFFQQFAADLSLLLSPRYEQ